jgi:hypothetical protein
MRDFLKVLKESKKKDHNLETLISLVTEIAIRNLRVTPSAIAILSIFINRLPNKEDKLKIANKIKAKFNQKPNSSYMMVWFQRLYLKINKEENYKIALCKKVNGSKGKIWNCEWLEGELKDVIDRANIVETSKVKKARTKLFAEGIENITIKDRYYN